MQIYWRIEGCRQQKHNGGVALFMEEQTNPNPEGLPVRDAEGVIYTFTCQTKASFDLN